MSYRGVIKSAAFSYFSIKKTHTEARMSCRSVSKSFTCFYFLFPKNQIEVRTSHDCVSKSSVKSCPLSLGLQ